jgi:proteic killer suppression protein
LIRSFRHRGLQRLYEGGAASGVSPSLVAKVCRILARLDVARAPREMDLPGWRLHPLHGDRRRTWSVRVSANWRITFRFDGQDALDVDLADYH